MEGSELPVLEDVLFECLGSRRLCPARVRFEYIGIHKDKAKLAQFQTVMFQAHY